MAIVLPSTVQLTKGISRYTNPLLTPETDESEECLLSDEMALQAAVALSGLSPQSFDGTLNRFYQQGAILLKNPNVGGTTSSTTKPDIEIRSQESGISSLSGRSAARRNLGPYFEMITGTKLAIQDAYKNERMLVDSLSPTLPSSPSSSSSSSSFCANLLTDKFITTIDDNDADIDDDDDDIDDDNNNKKAKIEIIYQGRDILDLYSNISKPFELQISQIGGGTKSFFENRSLFSRTAGIGLPAHLIDQCKCGYNEYSYF